MSKYRKVDPRIWNDEKFRRLTDQGKLAFFFILTHPHMTAVGAMRASVEGLAAELKWPVDAMRDAISDAMRHGMIDANEEASYMGLPRFLKYNEPEGPNSVIKAWPAALELIPECAEKAKLATACHDYLLDKGCKFFGSMNAGGMWDAIRHAMHDAMSDPSPIQEQEQEQEQEYKNNPPYPPDEILPAVKKSLTKKKVTSKIRPVEVVDGLDADAWIRWQQYRIDIRKPIKQVSIPAAQRALAVFGADQASVVEQAIANGWQGLFPLRSNRSSSIHDDRANTIAVLTGRA